MNGVSVEGCSEKYVSNERRALIEKIISKPRKFGIPKFSYRFMGLSEHEMESIILALTGLNYDVRKFDDSRGIVVFVDLNANTAKKVGLALESIVVSKGVKHGIWASLVTQQDSHGFTFPKYVCDLMRKSEGGIDVSFTVV